MAWLRLDDGFATHPKIAALTDRELRVWLRVLCYCSRQRDPTIDAITRQEVVGLTSAAVNRFAGLELLDVSGQDHEVHDWEKYQPKDLTGSERQARWRSRRNGCITGNVTDDVTDDVTEDIQF